ncbi:hypothetical protein CDO31_29295 (plasmid) [Sinorhizobium meliloti]|nr:hypothetical protein CDO31_29295 [Sinorhizobium meliloti]
MVATAVGIVKDLRGIEQGLDKAEMKARLADVLSTLADVKMALIDAQEESREKDAQIERLRGNFAIKEKTIRFDGFSMLAFEDGKPRGMPFCPRCEAVDGILIHLADARGSDCQCPQCKATYSRVPRYLWER